MIYLPPFVVHGTHLLTEADLENYARLYRTLLERLAKGEFDVKADENNLNISMIGSLKKQGCRNHEQHFFT